MPTKKDDKSNNKWLRIQIDPKVTVEPKDFIWDENAYSCAYDSLFVILLYTMKQDQMEWNSVTDIGNNVLNSFT